MYRLLALFTCMAVGVSNPSPNQPWPSFSQPVTPSYWQTSGSVWSNSGSRPDPRGEGWGPSSYSSGSGLESLWPGSSRHRGGSEWGSKRCGGITRRSRCAPSIFEIERQLMGAAEKMTSFCSSYSDRPLREIYGVEHFKLRVRLSEFSEDDIQVRVRQRLVTVLARTCAAEYAAMRILPDVVDARQALWKMDNHTLTVLFPYNISPNTEIQSRCGREFHGDPIIVPKCAPGTVFPRDYDMSFTDAKLREAIKRVLQELAQEDNEQYVDN